MSRSLLPPLAMMLMIATAMALLATAIVLPAPAITEIAAPDGAGVVERFYAAVNETITTGNPEPVRQVINPSFTDENPLPGVRPGREGLEAYLATLHAAEPGLRLEAVVLSASASQVVTQVRVQRGPANGGLATLGAQHAVWSPVEVFGIANGEIVRRWGQTDGLALARSLAVQQLELPVPVPRIVSLSRITQEPGTQWGAPPVAGPQLLVLEAGVLEVRATVSPPWGVARGSSERSPEAASRQPGSTQPVRLTTGRAWPAPAGVTLSTTNTGSAEARLLVVAFDEPQRPGPARPRAEPPAAAASPPAGVTAEVLAGGLGADPGAGPVTVTLDEIAFAPDASLNLWSTAGPLLVAVETGQLTATARGMAWVRRHADGMNVTAHAATLTRDNGLQVQPGGVVALHNDGQAPVAMLLVTIQAAGAAPGP